MQMLPTIFTTIPILLAVALIGAAIWEFMSWRSKFSNWVHGVGTSLGAVKQKGDVGPRLAYQYTIDGTEYEALSGYMKNSLPAKGEAIRIYYDPKDPSRSEWYNGGMHRYLMLGSLGIAAFILWLSI